MVVAEVERLAKDLDPDEVEVAREGLLRGLRMDSDLPVARCAMDVAEVLDRGRRFDLATIKTELGSVTTDEVRDLAQSILRPEHMAAAVCGPEGTELPG
jgi:predicted Zn-dependent peptidase